ncbi:hypothetical protein [Pseudonocardia sp. ICBG601]|uniref:DUF6933 domain-containing protein n=1 Tax=Pseudonocardia sp. ICBG601 TaxID=2846759 RepID=UPI001CF68FC2|nr:hypothetical protein [Pseudonocardia sp. ICBG601]
MIVRGTAKVLALVRPPDPLPDLDPAPDDWYANLLRIQRRNCLLLTHATTLFSVFRPAVTAAELRPLGPFVSAAIRTELLAEGLPPDALGCSDTTPVQVTRTASRRVLGVMNDHAFHIEHYIAAHGGLAGTELPALHLRLHRTINSLNGYVPPIDAARAASSS